MAIYSTLSFSELLDLNARLELELRLPLDIVQLQNLSPGFRLEVLLKGYPIVIDRELHWELISQAFSELQDFKIALTLPNQAPIEE